MHEVRVVTPEIQASDAVTVETLAEVTANIEEYVQARAARMAEAALAREKTEADARVKAVREDLGAQLQRQTAELAEAQQKLAGLGLIPTWRNEDGKRFVFVEDLLRVLYTAEPITPTDDTAQEAPDGR